MFRKIKEMYQEYKAYVRVDLVMYGVMILLVIIYVVYTFGVRITYYPSKISFTLPRMRTAGSSVGKSLTSRPNVFNFFCNQFDA